MSEPNDHRPRLSRKAWLKGFDGEPAERSGPAPEANLPADKLEQRARRGRAYLSNEAEAAGLLAGIDQAITERYGPPPQAEPTPARVRSLPWLGAAAVVLLLLAAAWWLFSPKPGGDELYAEYFSHLENDLTVTPMGEPGVTDSLAAALRPYNARRYAEAAGAIGRYLNAHADAPAALRLYYGISLLETGQLAEAETELGAVRVSNAGADYRAAAEWYLALIYIRTGRTAAAVSLLLSLATGQTVYREKAADLLDRLE